MSEMIERVALAISGSDDPANILTIHRDRARAAIKALRDPTPAMLKAMWRRNDDNNADEATLENWQEAIDEALK